MKQTALLPVNVRSGEASGRHDKVPILPPPGLKINPLPMELPDQVTERNDVRLPFL